MERIRNGWTSPTTRAGFTLVELMIVVVVLGILAAFSTPSVMRTIERNNARKDARAVAHTIKLARSHALSRGRVVLMTVDGGGGAAGTGAVSLYRMPANVMGCTMVPAGWAPGAEEPIHQYELPGRMKIVGTDHGGNPPVCFGPNGRVVRTDGTPFFSDDGNCEGYNFRMWIARSDYEAGTVDLTTCASAENRQTQKDYRDMDHFFAIHIPYNGSVEVSQ